MSALQNNDLRSEAKAYQRDKNHTAKWSRGATVAPGIKCDHVDGLVVCPTCATRPIPRDHDRLLGRNAGRHRQFAQRKTNSQAATLARKAFRNEVVDAMDGPLANVSDTSSGEEDVKDASAAPLPADAEVMYSYDAPCGPGKGSGILSYALNQAVQRFENKETEKLVYKEYDVVDDGKEGYNADADEDDYEFIDHAHLK